MTRRDPGGEGKMDGWRNGVRERSTHCHTWIVCYAEALHDRTDCVSFVTAPPADIVATAAAAADG